MSLRIKKSPELQKKLANLAVEDLKSIKKAGEVLKDTKFYHVEMDADGARIISSPDAYFGSFVNNGYRGNQSGGNMVFIGNVGRKCDIWGVGRLGIEAKDGMKLYDAWSYDSLNNHVDVPSLANVTKILDDVAIAHYEKVAEQTRIEQANSAEINKTIGGLFDSFGIE